MEITGLHDKIVTFHASPFDLARGSAIAPATQ